MPQERRLWFEREPLSCPECGGREMVPPSPEELEVQPTDPDNAPAAYPGMLECKRCDTMVQWEA